jgi:CheY-like chemotaxis protein
MFLIQATLMGTKYLIVDDDSILRTMFCAMFEHAGKVISAGNGHEALTLLREHYFDVVISDIQMPIMDGIEFCKLALEADHDFTERLIFVTGNPTKKVLDFCEMHSIPLFVKPVPISTLRDKATAILEKCKYMQLGMRGMRRTSQNLATPPLMLAEVKGEGPNVTDMEKGRNLKQTRH